MATNNINTEDVRVYAKALRLGNLRNNCSEIIHQAQIDKPSYLDFILDILKVELDVRQQNELAKRMKQARLPRCCDLDQFDFNHSAGVTKTQYLLFSIYDITQFQGSFCFSWICERILFLHKLAPI